MSDPLTQLLEQVTDQRTFLAFVDALAGDFADEREMEAEHPSSPYAAGVLGWENGRIDTFLDAAQAWGASTMGSQEYDRPHWSPWRRCAEILYAGKYYE
jgi:hypothetical protein